MKSTLKLTLTTNWGTTYSMCIELDDHVCQEIERIKPPFPPNIEFAATTFDVAVKVLKRREFRKELFTNESRRLGKLLAERMEDAEGWHDLSRMGPAQRALKE